MSFAAGMSRQERDLVLLLATEGLGNRALGGRLSIPLHRVSFLIRRLQSKAGCRTRTGLVAWAWNSGLVRGDFDDLAVHAQPSWGGARFPGKTSAGIRAARPGDRPEVFA